MSYVLKACWSFKLVVYFFIYNNVSNSDKCMSCDVSFMSNHVSNLLSQILVFLYWWCQLWLYNMIIKDFIMNYLIKKLLILMFMVVSIIWHMIWIVQNDTILLSRYTNYNNFFSPVSHNTSANRSKNSRISNHFRLLIQWPKHNDPGRITMSKRREQTLRKQTKMK